MMGVGDAVAVAVARVTQPVEGMHRHIAECWFERLAPVAAPVRLAHDSIAGIVYGSIRVGSAIAAEVIDARPHRNSEQSIRAQALVNGLWGSPRSGRGYDMSLQIAEVEESPAEPSVSVLSHTPRLVVLVHGFVETERRWRGSTQHPGLLAVLAERRDLTPITVRYNTGLAVAANGAKLAEMLDELHAAWPVPVESMVLVGHSMGGLVVRAACAAAAEAGHRWIETATDLVTIGTPHAGAPLGRGAAALARVLAVVPVTQPLAAFIDGRSRGLRDLEVGSDASGRVPVHVQQHFVAGVVTANPGHPLGAVVGDLMVRPSSGTDAGRVVPTNAVVFGRVHHLDLLHDERVIGKVLEWIDLHSGVSRAAPVG